MFDPSNIIQSLFGPEYVEVAMDIPVVIYPGITAKPIINEPYKWVQSFLIRVRTMGTATYVRLGGIEAQVWTLQIKGQTIGASGGQKEVFDLSRIYCISDTADAEIELLALYIPTPMQGSVQLAQRL